MRYDKGVILGGSIEHFSTFPLWQHRFESVCLLSLHAVKAAAAAAAVDRGRSWRGLI